MQGDGRYEGDESVPQHGEPGQPDFETGLQPKSRGMSSLRYRLTTGRKTVADSGETAAKAGARTAGATAPTLTTSPRPGRHTGWGDDIAGARATRLRWQ